MLGRLFPRAFDNSFRGHWLAIVLVAAVALVKGLQGVNSILFTRAIATSADGLAIDSLSPAAAETVLSMFALLGFYLLLVPLQCAVVLLRYRSMIPFMYLMLLVMQLGSRLLLSFEPAPRTSALPVDVLINLGVIAVTLAGFVLSLAGGGSQQRAGGETTPAAPR